jgi:hypothetical protein
MAYIESFLYYILVALAPVPIFGILIFVIVVVINFFRGKSLSKSVIKKIVKWFAVGYLAFSLSFFISKSMEYYSSDRAYPQAKSYAIVADLVSFWHVVLLGTKIDLDPSPFAKKYARIIYPYSPWDQKIRSLQSYLLEKMYRYIPQEDGERELLYYRYKVHYIATMNYKFMRRVDYEVHGDDKVLAGLGKYVPKQTEVHDEMLQVTHALDTKPMKDRVFDKADRYSSIFRMSDYIASTFQADPNLERMTYMPRYRIFENNATAFGKYTEYIYFLDALYSREHNNTQLRKKLNKTPLTQSFLLRALLEGMQNIISYQIKSGIYPCGNRESKRYLAYHKEYYDLAHSRRSTKYIKRSFWQLHAYFYAAKYICEEDLDYETFFEKKDFREYPNHKKATIASFLRTAESAYGLRTKKMKKLKEKQQIANDK